MLTCRIEPIYLSHVPTCWELSVLVSASISLFSQGNGKSISVVLYYSNGTFLFLEALFQEIEIGDVCVFFCLVDPGYCLVFVLFSEMPKFMLF